MNKGHMNNYNAWKKKAIHEAKKLKEKDRGNKKI